MAVTVTVTAKCFKTLPQVIHLLDLNNGLLEPSDTPCMFSPVSQAILYPRRTIASL